MPTRRRVAPSASRHTRLDGVDPAVIAYARDALASGQTVEATVRRLRALGLCPPGFFDAYDWQDIVREPHATAQPPRPPPPQRMSSGTKSLLQRLALFIASSS